MRSTAKRSTPSSEGGGIRARTTQVSETAIRRTRRCQVALAILLVAGFGSVANAIVSDLSEATVCDCPAAVAGSTGFIDPCWPYDFAGVDCPYDVDDPPDSDD